MSHKTDSRMELEYDDVELGPLSANTSRTSTTLNDVEPKLDSEPVHHRHANLTANLTPDSYTFLPQHTRSSPPPSQQHNPPHKISRTIDIKFLPDSVERFLTKSKKIYKGNVGLLLIAISQFFSACMNTSVKILNGIETPVPPFEIIMIRMAITYVLCISYMYYTKVSHPLLGPPGIRLLLTCRGVVGFFGLFGMYYALQYLSLSDGVTLYFLVPIVTACASHFILGEVFSRKQGLAGVISLLGVVLIARPTFLFGSGSVAHSHLPSNTNNTSLDSSLGANITQHTGLFLRELVIRTAATAVGINPDANSVGEIGPAEKGTPAQRIGAVGMSLLGVCGVAGATICLRSIGTRAHTLHSLNYFSAYSFIVSGLGMIIFRIPFVIPMQFKFAALLGLIGLFGLGAQITLTVGLQRETASRGSLANYVQILFAIVLQRIFFHVYPSLLSLVGAGLILGCVVYVAVSKDSDEPPTSRERARDLEEEMPLQMHVGGSGEYEAGENAHDPRRSDLTDKVDEFKFPDSERLDEKRVRL